MTAVQTRSMLTDQTEHDFHETRYAARTWDRERRVRGIDRRLSGVLLHRADRIPIDDRGRCRRVHALRRLAVVLTNRSG
jgi:hypothetical protein